MTIVVFILKMNDSIYIGTIQTSLGHEWVYPLIDRIEAGETSPSLYRTMEKCREPQFGSLRGNVGMVTMIKGAFTTASYTGAFMIYHSRHRGLFVLCHSVSAPGWYNITPEQILSYY